MTTLEPRRFELSHAGKERPTTQASLQLLHPAENQAVEAIHAATRTIHDSLGAIAPANKPLTGANTAHWCRIPTPRAIWALRVATENIVPAWRAVGHLLTRIRRNDELLARARIEIDELVAIGVCSESVLGLSGARSGWGAERAGNVVSMLPLDFEDEASFTASLSDWEVNRSVASEQALEILEAADAPALLHTPTALVAALVALKGPASASSPAAKQHALWQAVANADEPVDARPHPGACRALRAAAETLCTLEPPAERPASPSSSSTSLPSSSSSSSSASLGPAAASQSHSALDAVVASTLLRHSAMLAHPASGLRWRCAMDAAWMAMHGGRYGAAAGLALAAMLGQANALLTRAAAAGTSASASSSSLPASASASTSLVACAVSSSSSMSTSESTDCQLVKRPWDVDLMARALDDAIPLVASMPPLPASEAGSEAEHGQTDSSPFARGACLCAAALARWCVAAGAGSNASASPSASLSTRLKLCLTACRLLGALAAQLGHTGTSDALRLVQRAIPVFLARLSMAELSTASNQWEIAASRHTGGSDSREVPSWLHLLLVDVTQSPGDFDMDAAMSALQVAAKRLRTAETALVRHIEVNDPVALVRTRFSLTQGEAGASSTSRAAEASEILPVSPQRANQHEVAPLHSSEQLEVFIEGDDEVGEMESGTGSDSDTDATPAPGRWWLQQYDGEEMSFEHWMWPPSAIPSPLRSGGSQASAATVPSAVVHGLRRVLSVPRPRRRRRQQEDAALPVLEVQDHAVTLVTDLCRRNAWVDEALAAVAVSERQDHPEPVGETQSQDSSEGAEAVPSGGRGLRVLQATLAEQAEALRRAEAARRLRRAITSGAHDPEAERERWSGMGGGVTPAMIEDPARLLSIDPSAFLRVKASGLLKVAIALDAHAMVMSRAVRRCCVSVMFQAATLLRSDTASHSAAAQAAETMESDPPLRVLNVFGAVGVLSALSMCSTHAAVAPESAGAAESHSSTSIGSLGVLEGVVGRFQLHLPAILSRETPGETMMELSLSLTDWATELLGDDVVQAVDDPLAPAEPLCDALLRAVVPDRPALDPRGGMRLLRMALDAARTASAYSPEGEAMEHGYSTRLVTKRGGFVEQELFALHAMGRAACLRAVCAGDATAKGMVSERSASLVPHLLVSHSSNPTGANLDESRWRAATLLHRRALSLAYAVGTQEERAVSDLLLGRHLACLPSSSVAALIRHTRRAVVHFRRGLTKARGANVTALRPLRLTRICGLHVVAAYRQLAALYTLVRGSLAALGAAPSARKRAARRVRRHTDKAWTTAAYVLRVLRPIAEGGRRGALAGEGGGVSPSVDAENRALLRDQRMLAGLCKAEQTLAAALAPPDTHQPAGHAERVAALMRKLVVRCSVAQAALWSDCACAPVLACPGLSGGPFLAPWVADRGAAEREAEPASPQTSAWLLALPAAAVIEPAGYGSLAHLEAQGALNGEASLDEVLWSSGTEQLTRRDALATGWTVLPTEWLRCAERLQSLIQAQVGEAEQALRGAGRDHQREAAAGGLRRFRRLALRAAMSSSFARITVAAQLLCSHAPGSVDGVEGRRAMEAARAHLRKGLRTLLRLARRFTSSSSTSSLNSVSPKVLAAVVRAQCAMQAVSLALDGARSDFGAFSLDHSTIGILRHLQTRRDGQWQSLASRLALPLAAFVAKTDASSSPARSASIGDILTAGDVSGALGLVLGETVLSNSRTTAITAIAATEESLPDDSVQSGQAEEDGGASPAALPHLSRALPLAESGVVPVTVSCAVSGPVTLLLEAARLHPSSGGAAALTVGELAGLVQAQLVERARAEAARRAADAGSGGAFLAAILACVLAPRSTGDVKAALLPLAAPRVRRMTMAGAHIEPSDAAARFIGVVDALTGTPLSLTAELDEDGSAGARPSSVAAVVGQSLDCPAASDVVAAISHCLGGPPGTQREWRCGIDSAGGLSLHLTLAARAPSPPHQHAIFCVLLETEPRATVEHCSAPELHAMLSHAGDARLCLEVEFSVALGRRAGEMEAAAAEAAMGKLVPTITIALAFARAQGISLTLRSAAADRLGLMRRPRPEDLVTVAVPERAGGVAETSLVESEPHREQRLTSCPWRVQDAALGCVAALLRRESAGELCSVGLALEGVSVGRAGLMAVLECLPCDALTGLVLHRVASDWSASAAAGAEVPPAPTMLTPSAARAVGLTVAEGLMQASSPLQLLGGLMERSRHLSSCSVLDCPGIGIRETAALASRGAGASLEPSPSSSPASSAAATLRKPMRRSVRLVANDADSSPAVATLVTAVANLCLTGQSATTPLATEAEAAAVELRVMRMLASEPDSGGVTMAGDVSHIRRLVEAGRSGAGLELLRTALSELAASA